MTKSSVADLGVASLAHTLTGVVSRLGIRSRLRWVLRDVCYRLDLSFLPPSSVTIDITDRCCLKCATCSKWTVRSSAGELTTAEWKKVIGNLRQWLGPFHLSFSGGEPFLRPDLLELVAFARGLGVSSSVISNGYLIGGRLANDIVASGLKQLTISLNGSSAAVHDSTRGVAGSYDRAVAAMKAVNAARNGNLGLSVSAVLMGHNRHEMVELIEWVQTERLNAIGFQALDDVSSFHPYRTDTSRPAEARAKEKALLTTDPNAMGDLLDEVIRLKRLAYPISNSETHLFWMKCYFRDPSTILSLPCRVAQTNFSIDPYGAARLCFNMSPVGDVVNGDPRQIWSSINAKRQRRETRACSRTCRLLNCNFSGAGS